MSAAADELVITCAPWRRNSNAYFGFYLLLNLYFGNMKYINPVRPSFLSQLIQLFLMLSGRRKRLEKEGQEFDYFEYPGMFHVWMVLTMLPESKTVVKQIGDLVRE